jgi:hypothetical protein
MCRNLNSFGRFYSIGLDLFGESFRRLGGLFGLPSCYFRPRLKIHTALLLFPILFLHLIGPNRFALLRRTNMEPCETASAVTRGKFKNFELL